jgi:hypothetical protein
MTFDVHKFLKRVADRLIFEFDGAGDASTPGTIGAAREHPARVQLEKLLPGGVGVGTGFVIDSYGSRSKQQDIIIYDKNICPIFQINDTQDSTYYPVEGVIAIGEVKSSLNSAQLEDAFLKIVSAKKLRRFSIAENAIPNHPATHPTRKYGSTMGLTVTLDEEFCQSTKQLDQIFGFILCGKFSLIPSSIGNKYSKLIGQEEREFSPNLLISLEDGYFVHCIYSDSRPALRANSAMNTDHLIFIDEKSRDFTELINYINEYIRYGRTVPIEHFNRYLRPIGEIHDKITVDIQSALFYVNRS